MFICCGTDMSCDMSNAPSSKSCDSVDQDQFLTILSREDALGRFEAALFPRPIPSEQRPLADALGCALAQDIVASIDVPPFDRSNVDGFAVRSADLAAASEAKPFRVMLNDEVIACGTGLTRRVLSGTATSIATGGQVPRGADAVIMVERTQPVGHRAIEIRRAASPGQFISYAGSDIARGEALLRAGTMIGSREIGICAACGIAEVSVARRPRVAGISTGDGLVPPGEPLPPAAAYETHGAIVTAALSANGGDARRCDGRGRGKVGGGIAGELGRTEFVMVSLVEGDGGLIAYPCGKGSGAITSFAQADGFLKVDALADQLPAGAEAEVTLFTPHVRVPDLVIVGSHCTGLDLVTAPLARAGLSVRSIAVGSLGGLAEARRCECDID